MKHLNRCKSSIPSSLGRGHRCDSGSCANEDVQMSQWYQRETSLWRTRSVLSIRFWLPWHGAKPRTPSPIVWVLHGFSNLFMWTVNLAIFYLNLVTFYLVLFVRSMSWTCWLVIFEIIWTSFWAWSLLSLFIHKPRNVHRGGLLRRAIPIWFQFGGIQFPSDHPNDPVLV